MWDPTRAGAYQNITHEKLRLKWTATTLKSL
jgi:hypothetical protein